MYIHPTACMHACMHTLAARCMHACMHAVAASVWVHRNKANRTTILLPFCPIGPLLGSLWLQIFILFSPSAASSGPCRACVLGLFCMRSATSKTPLVSPAIFSSMANFCQVEAPQKWPWLLGSSIKPKVRNSLHACIVACMRSCMHTCIHACILACRCACVHLHACIWVGR